MTELVGRTLAHYRITSSIGAGGMGEVYRATDTALGRDVAIKVLPPEFGNDPERLSRFRREAHLLASLNHPNIAAIYGLEEAEGQPFIALELVEGEDLKQRLARGRLPLDEALEIAAQIAEALEEAHIKGIVHRDLKPANVKLTNEGRVKVLDFGLAKAWAGDSDEVRSTSPMLSQSPTVAPTGTAAGLILGTAAYMSPEQARGKTVDRRADVWAFGVLLWEILTGRALFTGDTVTDVIASVVTREPDQASLPPDTPLAVRRLLSRCLRKDPRQRLPDMGAARLELRDVLAGTAIEVDTATVSPGWEAERHARTRERWVWAGVALLAFGLAGALGLAYLRKADAPPSAVRFTADLPDDWALSDDFGYPVPSPDGRQIAFRATPARLGAGPASGLLWVRPLESLTARPLAGTEGGFLPAWSPDGKVLAFFANGELRKLNLADGTVQRICAVPREQIGSADWGESGTILFSTGGDTGVIYAVSAAGGDAKQLTTLDTARGETNHHFPQFLPDGHRFLFEIGGDDRVAGTYVASLDRPAERRQVAAGWARRVYSQGHLLFVRDGNLLAQPFHLRNEAPAGEPVAVAPGVATWTVNAGFGWFASSPAGTLAYFSGGGARNQVQLAWFDRKGQQTGTIGAPGNFSQIALSPDERTVAIEIANDQGQYDIWTMDVARGVASRVTVTDGDERDPVWSPDGRSLAFIARTPEGADLRRKGLRASDPEIVVADSADEDIPEYWLSDGRTLLVTRRNEKDEQTVWALPLAGGAAEPLLTKFRIDEPQVSPDRRWLAYVSRESEQDEVYIEPFRREGERVRVSTAGGGQPKWQRDGRAIFFTTPTNRLMAATIRPAGDRVDVSLPTELFEMSGLQGTGYDDYSPSADGQRFLVKVPVQQERTSRLNIVTNWTSLLK